jgi:TusA-related sulfurtransferase
MMTEIVVRVIDDGREGSKLWEYVVHNEYADAKFGQILEACGKDPKVKREITPGLFMNLEADVQVKHETYEGQKRAKIHYWIKPEEGDAFEEERSPTEDDPLPF